MFWETCITNGVGATEKGDFARAELYFKQALLCLRQSKLPSDGKLASTLSFLGHIYFCNGRFAEAEDCLEQSLHLHFQLEGQDSPSMLMDLFALGQLKASNRKEEQLKQLYDEALSKLKLRYGNNSKVVEQAAINFRELCQLLKHNQPLLEKSNGGLQQETAVEPIEKP